MSDIKLKYAAEAALTVTGLHSLASSATAGWTSAVIDNTTNLYEDVLLDIVLDPANTAPANSFGFYVFGFGGTNSSDLHTTGAASGDTPGTEGALTFPDVTAGPVNMPLIGFIPYIAQNAVVKRTFAVAPAFGGLLLPYWGVAILNHSGAALAASGNAINMRGVLRQVI